MCVYTYTYKHIQHKMPLILTNISLPLENIATLLKVHVIEIIVFKKSQNHLVLTSYTLTRNNV